MIFYNDPAYSYKVTQQIRQHVFSVFDGEPINAVTLHKIKDYLERTVPGSAWKVTSEGWRDINLRVQFEDEKSIVAYLLKWS